MRKGYIISFALGLITATVVGVYAINSNEVTYKETTVDNALNDLYTKEEALRQQLSGLEEVDLSNISIVENKHTAVTNAQSGTVTHTNLPIGNYMVYTYRTLTSRPAGGDNYDAETNIWFGTNKNSVSVDNGTVAKISDEVYIVTVTSNSSTITITSPAQGSATVFRGYISSSLYAIN